MTADLTTLAATAGFLVIIFTLRRIAATLDRIEALLLDLRERAKEQR